MVQIQIDVDEDLSNKIDLYRVTHKLDTKAIAVTEILKEFMKNKNGKK